MKKKIDIIIFCGQSNMQGQSEKLTDKNPVEHAYEYKWLSNSFAPLQNPVGEDITYDRTCGEAVEYGTNLSEWLKRHVTGSACYGNTNLVPKFCEKYIEQTGSEVLAVHVAKGSTQIVDWMPGSAGFNMLIEKSKAAIREAKKKYLINRIFFVWLQGESDAIAANAKNYYKEILHVLNISLRVRLEIEKFCMIRVGYFTNDERDRGIISAQDEICWESNEFLMLTDIATQLCANPEYMNPFVKGHYSAKGLELLGATAGEALGKYVKGI